MDIHEQLGENVKRERLKAGISQEDLAHAAELDRTYVSGIERGIRNPTVKVLVQLADVLRIAPAQLLDGIGKFAPRPKGRSGLS